MACELCDHCNYPITPGQAAVYQGCSYHENCRKCFVCSETDLQGGDVFHGVIFCSGCSKRIFQGCKSARKSKNKSRRKTRPINPNPKQENVIEIAKRHINESRSDSDCESYSPSLNAIPVPEDKPKNENMKKESVEMGTTTDVTLELLKQMNYPILNHEGQVAPPVKYKKSKKEKVRHRKKKSCSDLRIAELGASTEIAHMALRQRSAVPIIIKSESHVQRKRSKSPSLVQQDSDSRMVTESNYTSNNFDNRNLLDRRIGSIIRIPYIYFKKNILDRSSVVSILMANSANNKCAIRRLKRMFQEEMIRHQQRGLKKLFSTINRKKTPYKLGWLPVKKTLPRGLKCRHHKSHSYRCMRAQVMRLAGPTTSELAVYRTKIKKIFSPKVVKRVVSYNRHFEVMLNMQAGNLKHQNRIPFIRN